MIKRAIFIIGIVLGGLSLSQAGFAETTGYDRYGRVFKEAPKQSTTKKALANILVFPLEIIRYPIDQSLLYIKQHHLEKKVIWAYDTLQGHGISPRFGVTPSTISAGTDVELLRLTQLKPYAPDLNINTWVDWSDDRLFEVGTKIGLERIRDSGFRTSGIVQYSDRPEEHFHGIGPDTSRGEGTSYNMEYTKLGLAAGYSDNPSLGFDVDFNYHNVNITNGEDGGRGIIDNIFPPNSIPGLGGDEMISFGAQIHRDTRNKNMNSTRGSEQTLRLDYFEGVSGSDARFFRYQAETKHYFRLGSDRRVLALRAYGEHNDELDDKNVPFHQMAKLGGYGVKPRLSHTLRGYDFNRFFDESLVLINLEYRYTIYEYREFKMDTVAFWDEGQVFGEFSNFQFSDFKESYGLGFRVSVADVPLLSMEVAHGDEGTNFYVKSTAPF